MQKRKSALFWGAALILSMAYIGDIIHRILLAPPPSHSPLMRQVAPMGDKAQDRVADLYATRRRTPAAASDTKRDAQARMVDALKRQIASLQQQNARLRTRAAVSPTTVSTATPDTPDDNANASMDADAEAFARGLRGGGHIMVRYRPLTAEP